MIDNYTKVKRQLQQYSFTFLDANTDILKILDEIRDTHPEKLENAVNLELLASGIVFVYARNNKLNGRGGITAKSLAEYFKVSAQGVGARASEIDYWLGRKVGALDEYIDTDRYEAEKMFWDFSDSKESQNVKKAIKKLELIIKTHPDYFDPYSALHDYYLSEAFYKPKKAFDILEKGFSRAIRLISRDGLLPKKMEWGFTENRHIIRIIYHFAMLLWTIEQKDDAIALLMDLYRTNENDNIGARYAIVAILDGFENEIAFNEAFAGMSESYVDASAMEEWFEKAQKKHKVSF